MAICVRIKADSKRHMGKQDLVPWLLDAIFQSKDMGRGFYDCRKRPIYYKCCKNTHSTAHQWMGVSFLYKGREHGELTVRTLQLKAKHMFIVTATSIWTSISSEFSLQLVYIRSHKIDSLFWSNKSYIPYHRKLLPQLSQLQVSK